MSVEVASWNIASAFEDERRFANIEDGLGQMDADVVFISEAYGVSNDKPEGYEDQMRASIDAMASRLGYQHTGYTPYEGEPYSEGKPDGFDLRLVVMGKMPLEERSISLERRNAVLMNPTDQQTGNRLQIVGVHLDDTNEASRLKMARALLNQLDLDRPALVIGDMNSMHRDDRQAKLVRTDVFRFMGEHIIPTAMSRSLAARLIEMADGSTQESLAEAGLIDADPAKQSTFIYKGVVFGQLDHILTSGLKVTDFRANRFRGSDHKAISATIHSDS